MKVRYESDDGMVSGYGDEGKAAVEAHEADPLARFYFPWEYGGRAGVWCRADGGYPSSEQFTKVALLGSRLALLVQKLVANCVDEYGEGWRSAFISTHPTHRIAALEDAMNEVLNG